MRQLRPRLVTRAAPLPTVAASSVSLFWDLVELFGTDPGEWKLTNSRFELRRRMNMNGGWLLTAILDAFTIGPGYRRLYSWINVRLSPPSQAASRSARHASWFVMLTRAFAERGYSRDVHPLSFARRLRGARAHAAERAWIEALFGVESRGATKARAQGEAAVWTALRAFAGDGAGEWVPVNAGYEIRRPFGVLGRSGGTVCTKLHPIQWDQGARTIRRPFIVDASVTVWMPDLKRRELAATSGWRERVVLALRSLGYRGEWQRIKGQPPFGDFWKNGIRTTGAVRHERDVLARFRLPPTKTL